MQTKIQRFLNSNYLMLFMGAIIVLAWALQITEMAYIMICIIASLTFLYCKDLSPLTLCLCLALCVRFKGSSFDLNLLYWLLPAFLFLVFCFIRYFVVNYIKPKKKVKIGKLWFGLLLAFIACFMGGLFSPDASIGYMFAASAIALFSYFVYFIVLNTTNDSMKDYFYKILLTICSIALVETIIFYAGCNDFFEAVLLKQMDFGWLMTNSAATLYSMVMPFVLYQSLKSKRPWIHYIIFMILCYLLVLTLSKTAWLFAGILIPIAVIYTFIKCKSKKQMLLVFASGIACVFIFYFAFKTNIDPMLDIFMARRKDLNGRSEIWDYCLLEFKKYPAFGVGFFGEDHSYFNYSERLLHNTFLQILCCTGIIGSVLFVPYFYQRYKLLFTKFSLFKLYAFISVALWELGGIFDINFIRVFQVVLIFSMLAICENEADRESPALVFRQIKNKIKKKKVVY